MNHTPHTVVLLLCLTLCSCGFNSFAEPDDNTGTAGSNTARNADLEILYDGTYDGGRVVAQDFVFEGYVTANGSAGNFFGSIIVQDRTAAIEISAGFGGLQTIFPEGRRVVVLAKGAALIRRDGIIVMGLHIDPYSTYRVEPFGAQAIMERYVLLDTVIQKQLPEVTAVADLDVGSCGKLVEIEGLTADRSDFSTGKAADLQGIRGCLNFATEGISSSGRGIFSRGEGGVGVPTASEQGEKSTGSELERPRLANLKQPLIYFADPSGNKIALITEEDADFAGETIPVGEVSLTGILLYGKFGPAQEEMFGLKLRSIEDIYNRHY